MTEHPNQTARRRQHEAMLERLGVGTLDGQRYLERINREAMQERRQDRDNRSTE